MNDKSPAQQAIEAALACNWKEAIKINLEILKTDKTSIQALNRLAQAYHRAGHKKKSILTYKKVLRLDKYNPIALKNLTKIKLQKGKVKKEKTDNNQPDTAFLKEPGKTKTVNLIKLAPKQILLSLSCAEKVLIKPKKRSVSITTQDNRYIGALPDDLSLRLISFIKGGNQYGAFIKSATQNQVTVFLRETKKAKRFEGLPSFAPPGQSQYYSFVKKGTLEEDLS